jgi:hypothetical protein
VTDHYLRFGAAGPKHQATSNKLRHFVARQN